MQNWRFRPKGKSENQRDPIEGNFFTTNAINGISEALVREAVQNSLDAKDDLSQGPVEVRFNLKRDQPVNEHLITNELRSHLMADGNGLNADSVPDFLTMDFLVIEDFNTTGLIGQYDVGSVDETQKQNFYWFWRAVGKSVKHGDSRGRWGLGKDVFNAASRINTMVGLSYTEEYDKLLFLGKCVLKHHRNINGDLLTPYGYFGNYTDKEDDDFVLPVEGHEVLKICKQFELERLSDKEQTPFGFSSIILYPQEEIDSQSLLTALLNQYYQPLISGDLMVDIFENDKHFELKDYLSVLSAIECLDWKTEEKTLLKKKIEFVRWALSLSDNDPLTISSPKIDVIPQWRESNYQSDILATEEFYDRFENGERLAFKIPINVKLSKNIEWQKCYFAVYIEKDEELKKPDVSFIREGITVTNIPSIKKGNIRALCMMSGNLLATLLGDSENPAHTEWQKNALQFKGKYTDGDKIISFVTRSVEKIFQFFILKKPEGQDENLLIDFLSVPEDDSKIQPKKKKKNRSTTPPPLDEKPKNIRKLNIHQIEGGFKLISNPEREGLIGERFKVKVAYRRRKGNPFKKWTSLDFDLGQKFLEVSYSNLEIEYQHGNEIHFIPLSESFHLEITGFDVNRDLIIKV